MTHARFRTDIQGLRAVAVGLVLLYHANVPGLAGGYVGVDVFFVISGFLITGLLIREITDTGRVDLAQFWSRRARRILPAAFAALLGILVLTALFLPETRWANIGLGVAASSVYVVNWLLAATSVNYLAQGDVGATLVQHFWSLAVEEQFYLGWPLVVIGAVLIGRRFFRAAPIGVVVAVAAVIIAVPSLVWSIVQTGSNPGAAYFVTPTRVWELAIGAGLAGAASHLRLPRPVATALGWVGLAAILASAVLYDQATPFPGIAALAPVLGAAFIIAAGLGGLTAPSRLLATAPMVWVGSISYSLYLWHWPLLVVGFYLAGTESPVLGLAIVAASFLPAWLSYRYLEPIQRSPFILRSPTRRGLAMGAAITVAGALVGGGLYAYERWGAPTAPTAQQLVSAGQPFGAEVLTSSARDDQIGAPTTIQDFAPTAPRARDDFDETCPSTPVASNVPVACTFGSDEPTQRVLLLGDSHLRQWLPALRVIAAEDGWAVTAYFKDACPFISAPVAREGKPYAACDEWNANLQEIFATSPEPDRVITSNARREAFVDGRALSLEESDPYIAQGLSDAWTSFTSKGVPVSVIRDTPTPGFDVPDCVAGHRSDLAHCGFPRASGSDPLGHPQIVAAEVTPLVDLIDLNDAICPTEECAPVIGGVLVYLDSNHITGTYAISLVPRLREALHA